MDIFEKDILKWWNDDRYRRIGSDVSVTELMKPPRIVHLSNRHRTKTQVTSMDNIMPALMGMGIHDQLQRYLRKEDMVSQKWMIERHLCSVVDGVRIAGRFDALYDGKVLYDIKTTKAWKFMKGDFSEWEEQLNIYDYMLHLDKIELDSLKIYGYVVDYSPGNAWKQGYPDSRRQLIDIARWARPLQKQHLEALVNLWKTALSKKDNKLPLCTADQRWARNPSWKLYRLQLAQKATKVFPSKSRAERYLKVCQTKDPTAWKEGYIKKHHDEPWKRCESWCDVAPFCNQFKKKLV